MTVQHPVEIAPVQEPSFVSPCDEFSFYCNSCKSYSRDFYNSAVKTGYRRCRPCHQATTKARLSQQTTFDELVKKLKSNFTYKRQTRIAKAVKEEHVRAILKNQGIEFEDQLNFVKTISPNYDPMSEKWTYTVVFKSGALGQLRGRNQ